MKVYKRYRYNLAPHCKFAQTYGEAEEFLRQNGLTYQNALYYCEDSGLDIDNRIGNVLRKYPELKKHLSFIEDPVKQSVLSNCDAQWVPKTGDDDRQLVRILSSKVPRPFSFAQIGVALNCISFFNRDSGQSVDPKAFMWDSSPLSSNICLFKWFDSGLKYNIAYLTIDVTDDVAGKTILDDSDYVRSFEAFFGCAHERVETLVSAPELAQGKEVQIEIERIIAEAKEGLTKWEGSEERLEDQPLPSPVANKPIVINIGSRYSFKKSLNLKKRKASGYEYLKYDSFCYFLRKRDEFNHAIELEISTGPVFRRIEALIDYRGMTFRHHFRALSFTPQDQGEADRYMVALLDVMANLETKYLRRIGALYPRTPEWYVF